MHTTKLNGTESSLPQSTHSPSARVPSAVRVPATVPSPQGCVACHTFMYVSKCCAPVAPRPLRAARELHAACELRQACMSRASARAWSVLLGDGLRRPIFHPSLDCTSLPFQPETGSPAVMHRRR